MIRQWLDQNMPRIVERALKIEVASVTATERDKGPTGRSA
jgi:cell pole-organizing protein PopZ